MSGQPGRIVIAWVVVCAHCEVHKILPVGRYSPNSTLKVSDWQLRFGLWYCPICKDGNYSTHT